MKKVLINDDCTKFIPFSKIEYFKITHYPGRPTYGYEITARTSNETHIIEYRKTMDEAVEYVNSLLKNVKSI